MNKTCLVWASISLLIFLSSSCNKNDDKPNQVNTLAWAVGAADSTAYAQVLFSSDQGENWIRQCDTMEAIKGKELVSVFIDPNGLVWAAGRDATLIKTADKGQNWEKVTVSFADDKPDFAAVASAPDATIWVSGSDGFVMHSTNNGIHWIQQTLPFFNGGFVQGITAVNNELIVAVGGKITGEGSDIDGAIAVSRDGGTSWGEIVLADNYGRHEWIGVKHFGNDHIVVYGEQGHYTYTTDAGETWINDSLNFSGGGGMPPDINGLSMISESNWWAVLDLDHVMLTTNQGASWTDQGSAGQGNMFLMGIDHANEQIAIATGASAGWPQAGKILQTTNAGNTWMEKYQSDAPIFSVAVNKKQ